MEEMNCCLESDKQFSEVGLWQVFYSCNFLFFTAFKIASQSSWTFLGVLTWKFGRNFLWNFLKALNYKKEEIMFDT